MFLAHMTSVMHFNKKIRKRSSAIKVINIQGVPDERISVGSKRKVRSDGVWFCLHRVFGMRPHASPSFSMWQVVGEEMALVVNLG